MLFAFILLAELWVYAHFENPVFFELSFQNDFMAAFHIQEEIFFFKCFIFFDIENI
jgi:hypothetical protein